MKNLVFLAILSILWVLPAQAQLENKGWWTRDLLTYRSYHDAKGGDSGLGRTTGRFLTQPEFGYALNKRCLVGFITQYSNTFERQTLAPNASGLLRSNDRFFGAGPLFRYFIPLGKRGCADARAIFYLFLWRKHPNQLQYGDRRKKHHILQQHWHRRLPIAGLFSDPRHSFVAHCSLDTILWEQGWTFLDRRGEPSAMVAGRRVLL